MSRTLLRWTLCLALTMTAIDLVAAAERIQLDGDWRFFAGDPQHREVPAENRYIVPHWHVKLASLKRPVASKAELLGPTSGASWAEVAPKTDVFKEKPGFAWFRTNLGNVPGPHRILRFSAVDDAATVYLNGKELLRHRGWDEPFDVVVDAVWKEGGPNVLAVLVENTGGPGNVGPVAFETDMGENPAPIGLDLDDRSWRTLHLPHDFVVEGKFDPQGEVSHGSLPKGVGWYRKEFTLSKADQGRSLWIDFDGIYRDSSVWLNGQLLGRHASGYTSFRYDIGAAANTQGRNVLAVKVNTKGNEGWWYEGGGIYRHVWLNKADPAHLAPWGIQVLATPNKGRSSVEIRSTLVNASAAAGKFTLTQSILDADGKAVLDLGGAVSLAPGSTTITRKGSVSDARLWSLEDPALYTVVTTLKSGDQVIDRAETHFGFRTLRFDADKGFFLNDKPVKVKGTCNHLDFAGIGIALPDSLFSWRIKKLKEMGSNAWRCSHNPPSPEFLDACDRLGMLVMDENRRLGDSPDILAQVESMVVRDRNHPSIILWSLCNEEGLQGTEIGGKMGMTMKKLINKLDPTRPVTAAMNGGFGKGLSKVVDVQGFNYHDSDYAPFHKAHPNQPLFGSETASAVGTRGIYANDKERGYVSAYDVNFPEWAQTAEKAWRAIGERDYMAGGFVWTGFDYRGEPTPYGWPCINSHFGILDTCGFPKDSFYYYQSWWSDKTVLHIFPHWNWPGKAGQDISVWVYSNCDKVELFLNGASLGAKDMTRLSHLEWNVKYIPGVLSAKGYNKGQLVAENKVETTGKAASVQLKADRGQLTADGEDIVPVEVSILDAQGRLVPTASNQVVFSVTGPAEIAGVGNGDPSSHEPDKARQRSAFNGRCMVLVRAGSTAGPITLFAKSKGLNAALLGFTGVRVGR